VAPLKRSGPLSASQGAQISTGADLL